MSDPYTLPDDVLCSVFCYLTALEIVKLRKVCATFRRVTERKHVWLMVISRDIYPDLVPRYCKSFDSLSAHQTEVLALHLLRVQGSITSSPKPITSITLHQSRSITWLCILHGTWLLVASSDATASVLTLWSVHAILASPRGSPVPVAQVYLQGPVSSGKLFASEHDVAVALDIRSFDRSVEILGIRYEEGIPIFVRLAHLPGASRVRCLTDRFLGLALLDELSIPCLMDWRTGVVTKLRESPNRMGGCIAMAIEGNFVATVAPKQLEIFLLEDSSSLCSARRLCEFELPHPFAFAELMFDHISRCPSGASSTFITLRLLLSSHTELRLFEVLIPRIEDIHFREVWRYRLDGKYEGFRPSFGAKSAYISWLWGKHMHWEQVPLMFTYIPVDASIEPLHLSSPRISPQTFQESDMPALYAVSVRDHDETRGLMAFGNAFGELSVYDFSGSDPEELAECFVDSKFPPLDVDSRRVSVDPLTVLLSPPYPYNGPNVPSRDLQDALLTRWRPHLPEHPPEGWSTNLLKPTSRRGRPPWFRWTDLLDSYSWALELGLHILGDKIPLMICKDPAMTVFKAGGLLYLEHSLYDNVYVLDEGLTLADIPPVFDGSMDPLQWTCLIEDPSPRSESYRFTAMWEWEWCTRNRNRWQEMKDRGGNVDECWTFERPVQHDPRWGASPERTSGPPVDVLAEIEAVSGRRIDRDDPRIRALFPPQRIPTPPGVLSVTRHSTSASPARTRPEDPQPKEGVTPTDEVAERTSSEEDTSAGDHAVPDALPSGNPSVDTPLSEAARMGKSDTPTVAVRRPRRAETAPPEKSSERSSDVTERKGLAAEPVEAEYTTKSGASRPPTSRPREEEDSPYRRDSTRRAVRRRLTE